MEVVEEEMAVGRRDGDVGRGTQTHHVLIQQVHRLPELLLCLGLPWIQHLLFLLSSLGHSPTPFIKESDHEQDMEGDREKIERGRGEKRTQTSGGWRKRRRSRRGDGEGGSRGIGRSGAQTTPHTPTLLPIPLGTSLPSLFIIHHSPPFIIHQHSRSLFVSCLAPFSIPRALIALDQTETMKEDQEIKVIEVINREERRNEGEGREGEQTRVVVIGFEVDVDDAVLGGHRI